MGNAFLDETAVVPTGEGRYSATIDPVWNLRPLPQGGVVTAIALRAMAAELGEPAQRLRTLHTTFTAQVAHGPVDVDVEVLRRGRSMSHLRAEVKNPGASHGHLTTAVFGAPRDGFAFTELRPPVVPPPGDCLHLREPPPREAWFEPMPFWTERVDSRLALGHPWWDEAFTTGGAAEKAMWYRFDEPPFLDDGALDPFALVVLADTMPGAVGERLGPQDRPWFGPSVDLTVHLLDDCRSSWVLAHNRARFAGDGYASADMALWDCGEDGSAGGEPRLVAYATQLFFFTFSV